MSIQYTVDQLQRKFQGGSGNGGFARIAEVLREEGRLEESLNLLKQGLSQRPESVTGQLVLGKCYADLERFEEAREAFETVLRSDPRCLSAMHHLARIMGKLQWPEAAAAYYRSILELEPWDIETLARLRDIAPAGAHGLSGAPAYQAPSPSPSAFQAGPVDSGDLSDGLSHIADFSPGETPAVEEFALDKVADFLPAEANPGDLAGALEEVSLEEALSAPPAEGPRPSPFAPSTAPADEPIPLDVLSESAASLVESDTDSPAPISGDDVGERLDSLFGDTDDKPMAQASFSPAPPAFDADADPRSADATIQLQAMKPEAAETPLGHATAYAPAPAIAEVFREDGPSASDTSVFGEGELIPLENRVSGDDIERRLDDLFSIPDETRIRPVMSSPDLEPTTFSPPPTQETAPAAPEATAYAPLETADPESQFEPEADLMFASEMPLPEAPAGEVVSGDDVADKLDALFGAEPFQPIPEAPATRMSPEPDLPSGTASWAAARPAEEEPLLPHAPGLSEVAPDATSIARTSGILSSADWNESLEGSQPPGSDLMSTESMLPRRITDLGRLGTDSAPPITGDDIEDRLDSLFSLGDEGTRSGAAFGEETFEEPSAPIPAVPESPFSAGDPDRTMVMPAMRETGSDWLARQGDDAPKSPVALGPNPSGNETLFMPTGVVFEPGESAPGEATQASTPSGSDTVGLEMVDGSDIADRLDQIFAPEEAAAAAAKFAAEDAIARGEATAEGEATLPFEESPAIETGEMPLDEVALFAQDPEASLPAPDLDLDPPTAETMVSGEDIGSRLSEIFEDPTTSAPAPRPLEEEDAVEVFPAPVGRSGPLEALPGLVDEEASPAEGGEMDAQSPPGDPVPGKAGGTSLSPMEDEEEGALEEEDNSPQSAAGANVATVTLAEIYFQQGLREQALQIYRQLLEREPGNDSVRKRIQEIEATKPDAGATPGADARRPRPGLKVPKRKK